MDHKAAIKRRDFLNWITHGIGGAAWSSMFLEDGFASQPINPHYAPNVKQVIHICLCGGFSQVDSFDYKSYLVLTSYTILTYFYQFANKLNKL